MTYALAAALQTAVYTHLRADPALTSLIGDAVYDTVPQGPHPEIFVALGAEQVRDASDKTGDGAFHDFVITVVSDLTGFMRAKTVAGLVSDALHGADLPLSRGALVFLHFVRARAGYARKGEMRRIDMTFRARVADSDPA